MQPINAATCKGVNPDSVVADMPEKFKILAPEIYIKTKITQIILTGSVFEQQFNHFNPIFLTSYMKWGETVQSSRVGIGVSKYNNTNRLRDLGIK